jgi:AcrR family transcriptional regulator
MTKQKLIEVAGEVFALKGFRDATVRDICEKAGANVAAINYHFGDKEKLYAEVFRYVHEVDCQLNEQTYDQVECPKESLKLYIEAMLRKMLMPGKFSWKGTLMAREMVDPSPVLDEVVKTWVKPLADELNRIVSEIINQPQDSMAVRLCASSVFGQIFFHKHGQQINKRLYSDLDYSEEQISQLSKHVYEFSISALEAIRKI